MKPRAEPPILDHPVVLDDVSFWYDNCLPRSTRISTELSEIGVEYFSARQIEADAYEWLQTFDLGTGDLVVVPTMSGALLFTALSRLQKSSQFQLGRATRSRHPLRSLIYDTPALLQQFQNDYLAATEKYTALIERCKSTGCVVRLFYCDTSTSLGWDAATFFEDYSWVENKSHLSLFNCTGKSLAISPGPGNEAKSARPSAYHVRLRGFDTVTVSSLALASRQTDGWKGLPRSVQPIARDLIHIVSAACADYPPIIGGESKRRRGEFFGSSSQTTTCSSVIPPNV